MSVTISKTIYPEGYSLAKPHQNDDDPYPKLATKKDVYEYQPGRICIAKSYTPPVIGKPNKMATFGEMLRIWDHVNVDLYQKLIAIKYLNA